MIYRVIFALIATFFISISSYAASFEIKEGVHYSKAGIGVSKHSLVEEFIEQKNDKVQVLVFFSYGCYWCSKFDPFMSQWHQEEGYYLSIHSLLLIYNEI